MKTIPLLVGGLVVAGGVVVGTKRGSAPRLGARGFGVAPWDVPDAPNPNPGAPAGAPPVADPPGLVRAKGFEATTDHGYTVRLVAVGRRSVPLWDEVLPEMRPVWSPDGSPYAGKPFGGANGNPAEALVDKGARYLAFEIEPPAGVLPRLSPGNLPNAIGYVPDGAREGTPRPELHGWDLPRWVSLGRIGGYQTCVVVDDRRASRYRFAIADGEWKPVASTTFVPSKAAKLLLSGPWGKLRHLEPPPRPAATRWTMADENGRYVVEPPSLAPAQELRVRFSGGSPYGPGPVVATVEARPWHWVELSGIHYDPDPSRWEKAAYWGQEGEAAVSRSGSVRLMGVVRPTFEDHGLWKPGAVYAPDGRRWGDHPDVAAIRPGFSGGASPKDAYVAALRFDEGRVSEATPARIEGYAATSGTPGQEIGAPLKPWPRGSAERSTTQILFERPSAPYVQFAVRYASDRWSKVGEIAVPRLSNLAIPVVPPAERAAYDSGRTTKTILTVILRSNGTADLWLHLPDDPNRIQWGMAKWPQDDEARVVVRLKSGRRVPLVRASSVGIGGDGTSSRDYDFDLTGSSGAVYDAARHDAIDKTRVRLDEAAAFEIETRGFSAPEYVVAKVPPR